GVEFSAEYEGTSIHVLGYFMDLENDAFQEELTRLRDDRFRRGEMIVEKLQSLGYDISFERVREIAGGGNIVRPHIAQAMVEAGVGDRPHRPHPRAAGALPRDRRTPGHCADRGLRLPRNALRPDPDGLLHDGSGPGPGAPLARLGTSYELKPGGGGLQRFSILARISATTSGYGGFGSSARLT